MLRERPARRRNALRLPGHVEPALGRELLAALRHQAAIRRPVLDREVDHRVRYRHLEIDARLHRAQQHFDVARLNVPPVFAQVHGDAVGARLLGDERGRDGIGVARAAGLPHCRNVIDVDAKVNGFHECHYSPRLTMSCNTSRLLQRPLTEMRTQHASE